MGEERRVAGPHRETGQPYQIGLTDLQAEPSSQPDDRLRDEVEEREPRQLGPGWEPA